MKILITGAGGMLGSDLASCLSAKYEVVGIGRHPAVHLQIPVQVGDLSQIDVASKLIRSNRPEIILHAAAMTDVDRCETERTEALRQNFMVTRIVTELANSLKALIVYFSTDYVFDGTKKDPYVETDAPHPLSVYGETKFLGERYVQLRGRQFLILRTSWTFGKHGNNFPKKILNQTAEKKPMQVVSDQFGSPTYTADLAKAVVQILEKWPRVEKKATNQIYHVANGGRVSRFEFARTILKKKNYPVDLVTPITSEQGIRPARRPQNSVLSTEKIKEQFGIRLRSWEEGLNAYLQEETLKVDAKA